jgi:hypothetical protein
MDATLITTELSKTSTNRPLDGGRPDARPDTGCRIRIVSDQEADTMVAASQPQAFCLLQLAGLPNLVTAVISSTSRPVFSCLFFAYGADGI